jgi:predicted DNA-binding transcriptional regulator AlpA
MENTVRHITQRELAIRWNKSEGTIERYRADGKGPQYLKIGGRTMYRIEDIEAFEQSCLRGIAHIQGIMSKA